MKSVVKYSDMKLSMFLIIIGFGFVMGCTATTREVSPDETKHYDAYYDFSDKKKIIEALVNPLIAQSFPSDSTKPVMIVYGIANRTSEHVDTSGITDEIRRKLMNSGKFAFINETQRGNINEEMAHQYSDAVDPKTRVEYARQVGAQYILSGTLRSIEKNEPRQWRVTRKTLMYYSLNLEMTDIRTGLIAWSDAVDLARESSVPIIGW